ncbi:MAG: hypothetical protein WD766_12545 [Gemmatimonadota bacterium]
MIPPHHKLEIRSMRQLLVVGLFAVVLPLWDVSPSAAQVIEAPAWQSAEVLLPPPAAARQAANGSRPVLRTMATLAGSAGAFAYAQSRTNGDPDDLLIPMAAGVAGGALGGLLLSNAHPLKVVLGSALSTLPAGAFAVFVAGSLPDEEQANIPLAVFSIPHGLLTSAFSQQR